MSTKQHEHLRNLRLQYICSYKKAPKNILDLHVFYPIMIFRVFINEHTSKTLMSVSTH